MLAEDFIAVYETTERVVAAYARQDRDAARAALITVQQENRVASSMMAWSATLAAAHTGQQVIDLLERPDTPAPLAAHLACLIDAAARSREACLDVIEEQFHNLSDEDLWHVMTHLADALWRWTSSVGGIEHWRKLLQAHDTAVVEDQRRHLVGPAAAVIALMSTGHLEQGSRQLGRIIGSNSANLTGLLQMWLGLAERWLHSSTSILALDWNGTPEAVIEPGSNTGFDDDGIDRVRLMRLVITLIEASRAQDRVRIQAAMNPILALTVEETMVLEGQLAVSLGMRVARWLTRPATAG